MNYATPRQREAFVGAQEREGWSLHLTTTSFRIVWDHWNWNINIISLWIFSSAAVMDAIRVFLFFFIKATTPASVQWNDDQEAGLLATAFKQIYIGRFFFFLLMTSITSFPSCHCRPLVWFQDKPFVFFQIWATWAATEPNPDAEGQDPPSPPSFPHVWSTSC